MIDHLGIEQSHVMGVSMGGMIVQQLAIVPTDPLLSMTSVMSTTGDPHVGRSTPEAQALLLGEPPTDRASAITRHLEGIRTYGSPDLYDEGRLTAVAGEAYDRAAAAPDFSMTSSEIQPVEAIMGENGWHVGCFYNQETNEQLQLYFAHMIKLGDPYELAHEIRRSLDPTNSD